MSKDFDEKLKESKQARINIPRVVVLGGLFSVVMILLVVGSKQETSKHVVKYKGNKSVVFKSIELNDTSLRVMHFEDVAEGMEYYKYINVGDTLDIKYDFKNFLTCDNYRISPFLSKVSNIRRINGKKLKEIREIAKRDSLLGHISQSNQRVK